MNRSQFPQAGHSFLPVTHPVGEGAEDVLGGGDEGRAPLLLPLCQVVLQEAPPTTDQLQAYMIGYRVLASELGA